ncbi:MAG: type II toxin-antitoxin system PemK/MazF family toxin [Calditrichaeota bacterium]|nr:MAG: type II toxin-antitoxin system PemK/MazF family toxin [Calditrichota bacterium]
MNHFKFGDIVLVNLAGEEEKPTVAKKGYALIISSDTVNDNLDTVIVCPMVKSEKTTRSRIGATFIPKEIVDLGEHQLILSFVIKTIVKDRIIKRINTLPKSYMQQVKESLQTVLSLD